MAGQRKKPADASVVSRLAGRGEDAITRLMDELGKNSMVTDALTRAMSAKGVVDERTRKTLGTVGLAAADEIKDLRGQLERLEKRLSRLEGRTASSGAKAPARRSTASRSGAKTSGTPKRSTTTAAKKTSSTTPSSSSSGSASTGSTSSGSTSSGSTSSGSTSSGSDSGSGAT
jgi:septal ring factor EnvC (AmiA/AmiB activator)